ncbi:redoxin family protein [Aerococcaceae bacterium zg-ZJ1578]|uniref:peroxiredoxin family protein n=1 Tax=Aerococcaceae TaxID=186827 RepID=UPI0013BAB6E0|nr:MULTISPECIES: redoxin family protein [unclassified Facklamia]MBK0347278.1 redoxin family protein [Aerococcaceae bacterium zg-1578]MBS4461041.1 redoxin family protein [Aerococcaceae bacterium zg-B36]QQD64921.1 redoxin family protein [Aerococcaceae bacterium zg-252]NEW64763.1 redoxin family protein [Facklamia sp. 252]NEW68087.1 redoxin family protein [Facklamia sp. 253]
MPKGKLLLTSLACVSILTACSTPQATTMTKKSNMEKQEQTMSDDKKDMKNDAKDMKEESKDMKSDAKDMKKDDKDTMATMNQGSMAPDFSLEGVDGKTYSLSDFKGKKVYLKFWASWCSICLATLNDTEELASKVDDKDYVILTVVSPEQLGEQSTEDFKKWYSGLDYKHMPVLIDPSGQLIKEYGVRAYPTAALIGSDGVLVKTHAGFMDKTAIESALSEIK